MVDRNRYRQLLAVADRVIRDVLSPDEDFVVDSQYDGHVASFGVSILLSGIRPTLAYYRGSTPKTLTVLELIRRMILEDGFPGNGEDFSSVDKLYATVVRMTSGRREEFKNSVLDYAVVLKHVIRTYNLT